MSKVEVVFFVALRGMLSTKKNFLGTDRTSAGRCRIAVFGRVRGRGQEAMMIHPT